MAVTKLEYIICNICNHTNLCNDDKMCSLGFLFFFLFLLSLSYFTPRVSASMFAERPILYNRFTHISKLALFCSDGYFLFKPAELLLYYVTSLCIRVSLRRRESPVLIPKAEKKKKEIHAQDDITLCAFVIMPFNIFYFAFFVTKKRST